MNTEYILGAYKKLSKNNIEVASLQTLIGKSDFTSIMFDRFVSILSAEGIKWDGTTMPLEQLMATAGTATIKTIPTQLYDNTGMAGIGSVAGVGIDIEHVVNMPDATDYWEDEFYKQHFADSEIAHCAAKDNPKESFAGIYACKEAIMKSYAGLTIFSFKELEIKFDDNGRPSCNGWAVSISHSNGICIAIAVKQ